MSAQAAPESSLSQVGLLKFVADISAVVKYEMKFVWGMSNGQHSVPDKIYPYIIKCCNILLFFAFFCLFRPMCFYHSIMILRIYCNLFIVDLFKD